MGVDFDYNVQGRFKLVTMEKKGVRSVLLVLHTVEDGSEQGTYWVLARKAGKCTWREVRQEGLVPRLHPRDRRALLHEEEIDRLDAECIRLLCACEARFARDTGDRRGENA